MVVHFLFPQTIDLQLPSHIASHQKDCLSLWHQCLTWAIQELLQGHPIPSLYPAVLSSHNDDLVIENVCNITLTNENSLMETLFGEGLVVVTVVAVVE